MWKDCRTPPTNQRKSKKNIVLTELTASIGDHGHISRTRDTTCTFPVNVGKTDVVRKVFFVSNNLRRIDSTGEEFQHELF